MNEILINLIKIKQNLGQKYRTFLLLGQTEVYIKHLESILFYAFEACKIDFTC